MYLGAVMVLVSALPNTRNRKSRESGNRVAQDHRGTGVANSNATAHDKPGVRDVEFVEFAATRAKSSSSKRCSRHSDFRAPGNIAPRMSRVGARTASTRHQQPAGQLRPGLRCGSWRFDGEYFHLVSRAFAKRFFFEVVERRGYRAYGAANAAIRLAAQSRYRDDLDQ